MQTSLHFWDTPPTEDLWWAPYVRGFGQISTLRDPIARINARTAEGEGKVVWGVEYRAPSVNVPVYLQWLVQRAEGRGVRIAKAALPMDERLETALKAAEEVVSTLR